MSSKRSSPFATSAGRSNQISPLPNLDDTTTTLKGEGESSRDISPRGRASLSRTEWNSARELLNFDNEEMEGESVEKDLRSDARFKGKPFSRDAWNSSRGLEFDQVDIVPQQHIRRSRSWDEIFSGIEDLKSKPPRPKTGKSTPPPIISTYSEYVKSWTGHNKYDTDEENESYSSDGALQDSGPGAMVANLISGWNEIITSAAQVVSRDEEDLPEDEAVKMERELSPPSGQKQVSSQAFYDNIRTRMTTLTLPQMEATSNEVAQISLVTASKNSSASGVGVGSRDDEQHSLSLDNDPTKPTEQGLPQQLELVPYTFVDSFGLKTKQIMAEDGKVSERSSFSPRTSFTADSPYYTSYVEGEMRQIHVLSDTLRDISARAKTFGKCGALMAEATRRLALACRLQPSLPQQEGEQDFEGDGKVVKERREAVGDEMMTVLSTLGEVLDEIADAQVQMCESLEASLSHSLEAFCGTEVSEVMQLQVEANMMTDAAEQSFARYLNGRHGASEDVGSWNKLSEQVSSGFSKTFAAVESTTSSSANRFKSWRGNNAAGQRDQDKNRDPSLVFATTAANLRLSLEQIRLAQTSAELKRFQLLQKLVSIKRRRNFELGESALASLHGIRAYFHHCSDLVQGLSPRMNRIQATQEESRESHHQARQPWQAREKGLVGAMDKVGKAVSEASAFADLMASGDISVPPTESVSLKNLEAETHVWELPTLLAEATRYQREPASGVLVEGWLYKKSSMRMALQQWNRRWFMMDKDGIYYFRTSAEMKKMGNEYLQTLERVKICDLVLCTVREIPGDPRFTFEIITPNQKPILLQARGPLEYKMWVDGIRSSIEMQLVSGEVDAGQLMKGIGKQRKFKRGSGDGATKTFASMLESEKVPSKSTSNISSSDDEIADDEEDKEWTDISAESDFRKSISKPRNPLIPDILESNPVCADCGQLNPDWVCMNLGVLVCIECSGVHRSLGVHVSKVRSLKLDSLSDSEGRLLLVMGNDRVNPIWEAGIGSQQGWSKPKGDSGRQAKENWIKSKYLWKGFLHDSFKDKSSDDKRMHYNKKLFEAARMADVLGVAEALAYGAEIEWQNLEEDGRTPLHICSLNRPSSSDPSSWTGIECAELLLQNGAKLDTMDNNTQGVLDCAVIGGGEREMVEFLSMKLQEKQNPGGRSS